MKPKWLPLPTGEYICQLGAHCLAAVYPRYPKVWLYVYLDYRHLLPDMSGAEFDTMEQAMTIVDLILTQGVDE
jgi:hypothetical protein